jgi:hypothetical protein
VSISRYWDKMHHLLTDFTAKRPQNERGISRMENTACRHCVNDAFGPAAKAKRRQRFHRVIHAGRAANDEGCLSAASQGILQSPRQLAVPVRHVGGLAICIANTPRSIMRCPCQCTKVDSQLPERRLPKGMHQERESIQDVTE